MKEAINKEAINFRVDKDLYDFVKAYAELKRMSISQVMRLCILDFYDKNAAMVMKKIQPVYDVKNQ